MSSELKANKISPATGTTTTLGDSGDTFDIPSGATLDVTGATVSGLTTGKVLQVVSAIDSTNELEITTTSSSYVDMGSPYSVTITPAATSSKIIVQAVVPAHWTDGSSYKTEFSFYRDIGGGGYSAVHSNNNGLSQSQGTSNVQYTFQIIDTPSTTSAVTYKLYWKIQSGTQANVLTDTVRSMYAWEIGA